RSQRLFFGSAIVGLALAIPAARGTIRLNAQQAASGASAPGHHIEGDWVRLDLQGAGSFGGLGAQIPPAELTAEGRGLIPARGGIRHIYMDGRKHPDLAGFAPSASGHSIGHYEGNVLVVDTIGLTPGGVPGGGYRTAESHLTERMSVTPDGKRLQIQYTYDDP